MSTRKSTKGRKTPNPNAGAAKHVARTTELALIMEGADEETLTDLVMSAIWSLSKRFGNLAAWDAAQSAALASGWDFAGGGVGAPVVVEQARKSVAS